MFKTIKNLFNSFVAAVKSIFSKKEVAAVSEEESFVEAPVAEETKAEKVSKKIVSYVARAAMVILAYIVVCNFPLTILFVMEMMAAYKAINWIACKVIA